MLQDRKTLPLLGAHAGRSARTCALKCGSACFHEVPNRTDNEYIGDVVTTALSRRGALKGAFGAMVLAGVPGVLGAAPAAAATGATSGGSSGTGLSFRPIPPTDRTVDEVVLPPGYAYSVLARWGDPVEAGAPPFDPANQSPEAQAKQFGYNCDYVGFFPIGKGDGTARSNRGLLAVNHEYTEPDRMFPGWSLATVTKAQVDTELAAHGMSVLEVVRSSGKGGHAVVPGSRLNRRITATTPMELTGPAAGHELLQTSDDPSGRTVLGMLNNCAGGKTPWGTVLTAEENFNQYFANRSAMPAGAAKTSHARYGLPGGASERGWEKHYARFDLAKEPNEPFRYGWIVEIDPSDPTSVPRKRTALGRFKHEAATTTLTSDGRVVAYMGDDERFDYVYKFVSSKRYVPGDRAHNLTLLDEGDLYVAMFSPSSSPAELERYNAAASLGQLPDDGGFDGSGTWIALVEGGTSRVPGFTVAQVLIRTREAADVMSPTKMDRPEDVERNPVNGRVYLALTNNTNRATPDEANPRVVDEKGNRTRTSNGNQVPVGNKYGHVIELEEASGDAGATSFAWRVFLVAGDPSDPTSYFAGYPKDGVSPVSCPDNLAFDRDGNLWIATDGAPGTIGKADAFHAVPVTGPERGRARQFLSVPAGAEACGPEFTPDQRALFCAVQHPGEGVTSHWPDGGSSMPRPSVITVFATSGDKRIGA